MSLERRSLNQPGVSTILNGTDSIVEALKEGGHKVTLKNWLDLAYHGDPPKLEDMEAEAILEIPGFLLPEKSRSS